MYQDPSGLAGLFSRIVSAAKRVVTTVVKTVTHAVATVARAVTHTVRAAVTTVRTAVTNVARNVGSYARSVVSTVHSAVNTVGSYAQNVYTGAQNFVYGVAQNISGVYNGVSAEIANARQTVSRYVDTKVQDVKQAAAQRWEDTKDGLEEGLRAVIDMKESVAEGVQKVGVWWQESDLSQQLNETAEEICAAWNNSAIGKTVAAIETEVNKAAEVLSDKWENSAVGQFCAEAQNAVMDFYEEHKTAINIAIGVAVIALCVVAVVATGGTACTLANVAARYALKGAVTGAISGTAEGAFSGALEYMEEHDTLDGAGSAIAESASSGFAAGSASGAVSGAVDGATRYMRNPNGFCFVAGMLILTSFGFANIEDIRPGDYVYTMNLESHTQELKPVLETYEREVMETYTITIEGEDIETTAEHPFYVPEEGFVNAEDLEVGDEVELADGDTGTVEDVEVNELDSPVTVYNFAVMDTHTYYVGEIGVLVHNACQSAKNATAEQAGDAGEIDISNKQTTVEVNGKTVTMDNSTFDPDFVDSQGRTNVQRMEQGLAPIGTDGKSVNIHHIDQTNDGPVIEITATMHQQNYSSLHANRGQAPSQINRSAFDSWRHSYWKWRSSNLN